MQDIFRVYTYVSDIMHKDECINVRILYGMSTQAVQSHEIAREFILNVEFFKKSSK